MQNKHKIILLLLVGTVLAVGLLRELGFVNLSRYIFQFQCDTSEESQTVRYTEPLANSTSVVVASSSDSSFAPALKAELEQQIKRKPGVSVAISVKQVDVEGWYWLPLWKRGHCVFQLQVRVAQGNTIRDTTISGEMEFTVTGVCSILTFKQILTKRIAQESMKYIEQ